MALRKLRREEREIRASDQRLTRTLRGKYDDEGLVDEPVIGLRMLPSRSRYFFDELLANDKRKWMFVIGAAPDCDIRLDDPAVSATHCLIERSRTSLRVYVHDGGSKNGIRVNGRLTKMDELTKGSLLTVGETTFIAFTERSINDAILIAASTLEEFVNNALQAYGSERAAASAIGVSRSTLNGWLRNKRFTGKL